MKLRNMLSAALLGACALGVNAQTPWIHIYGTPAYDSEGKVEQAGSFHSAPLEGSDIYFNVNTSGKFTQLRVRHPEHSINVPLSQLDYWRVGFNVPTFRISIPSAPKLDDVESKVEYLDGTLSIDAAGWSDDFSGDIQIRGRGNSTWNYPKKAYRIKLPEKTKICGYRKSKNYVLLANHIDMSMMRNEVACLATQYAGMPYPTHAMPVDVYFNDNYKGSYMLIEKVGVNNGSVNLSKEEEAETCMFELDTNYDEELKAASLYFNLPVMHKDPDAPEDPVAAKEWFYEWMDDFTEMEAAVFHGQNIGDYIDYTTLAKYMLVYNLACNQELNHPKSVYLYKTKGGKYQFGPCWDFDWAYGYSPTYRATDGNGDISKEEADRLIKIALDFANEHGFKPYDSFYCEPLGILLIWFGGEDFASYADRVYNRNWPYGQTKVLPSYHNYLLGAGQNQQGTKDGMGNGGEFFLSIIMDNPEFMAEYKKVWEDFKSHLDEFWADFDAYAEMLEPSARRNTSVWPYGTHPAVDDEFYDLENVFSNAGAIQVLRIWLQKRFELLDDESKNFGLYDPNIDYQPHK